MTRYSPLTLLVNSVGSPLLVSIAFLVFAAVPALLYTTYTLNYHDQNTRIEEDANLITQDISTRIAEVKTVMASLTGLHYASSASGSQEMNLFAEQLREQVDFITGIGRYEYVTHNDREAFEDRMGEQGLFNFKISDINIHGASEERPESSSYYPISMLEPLKPGNARLLGADLAAVASLGRKLDTVTANNKPLLATFPDRWPSGGELVLFAPVYRGMAAPSSPASRMLQSAGGFWISIDAEALLAGINQSINAFDVTARIHTAEITTMLYGQLGTELEPTYLKSLYLRKVVDAEWNTGDSSLKFTFQQDVGFSKNALVYFFSALFSILAVTALFTIYIVARRTAIQQRINSQDALLKERAKAEKTLNTVQDAIIALDSDMRVVHINPAAARQFKLPPADAVGLILDNYVKFRQVSDIYSAFNVELALENMGENAVDEFDVTPFDMNDPDFVLRLTLTNSITEDGRVTGHVLVLRDISHERQLAKKLAYQANHDALTGCTNRHYFENALSDLIEGLPESDKNHALCYLDLDQFKVINDTCGHVAGDQLLTDLTENIRLLIHDGDILSRLGGDEFGLLFLNVTEEEVKERSQRVYDFFQNYVFNYENKAFAVRASIGVVHIDQSCNNMKDVLASADMACYAAKDSGRNSLYVYSKTDDTIAERSAELGWLPRLRKAIERDEFKLVVQAVASVEGLQNNNDYAVEHYEFLLRLQNEDGSISTPWQFIQAAERYDLMTEIDRWVIENAFKTVAALGDGPGSNCSFSINLSGQSAADPTLKSFIDEKMKLYNVDPAMIWFELTETAAISQFSVAVDLINSIKSLGSLVALDDFGSGLSSFGYLKNLPVDILKIDGQFVKEIAKNPIDREMVRAIHQVGMSMGIKTVAEFVEDQDIVDVLSEIGVHYAQGYHIGKPIPIEEAVALLPNEFQKAA